MSLLERIGQLALFETHEIPELGSINIRKPGLPDIDKIEAVENSGEIKKKSTDEIKELSRMIALEFIVDGNGKPEFTEENVEVFTGMPIENQVDVILAFRKTFEKINEKAEELRKKQ